MSNFFGIKGALRPDSLYGTQAQPPLSRCLSQKNAEKFRLLNTFRIALEFSLDLFSRIHLAFL